MTLEDLYNGKSVKMNMEKEIVCGICKGYVEFAIPQTFVLTSRLAKIGSARQC